MVVSEAETGLNNSKLLAMNFCTSMMMKNVVTVNGGSLCLAIHNIYQALISCKLMRANPINKNISLYTCYVRAINIKSNQIFYFFVFQS